MEIERKYVLATAPDRDALGEGNRIEQLYLVARGAELRLRRRDGRCTLTIKSAGDLTRNEWESAIPEWAFDAMAPGALGGVDKTRYTLPYRDGPHGIGPLEIDEYHGPLSGLWTLECEFANTDVAREFVPPAWLGAVVDVTEDARYKNQQLALRGRPE